MKVVVYGPDMESEGFEVERLSFLNGGSYGPPHNLGYDGSVTPHLWVNARVALAVLVEEAS